MSEKKQHDTVEFRRALGTFTTGVTIVTTRALDGSDIGLTANSFNSVSLDPPMILWSLAKSAMSLDAFRRSEHFAVHILAEEQESISTRFAKRGTDKFSGLAMERGPADIPLLRDCAARFVCATRYQYEGGDHLIFVGEVVEFEHWKKLPLLFHQGRYSQIQLPSDAAEEGGASKLDDSLGYLLRSAYRKLIEPLCGELARRELTLAQHYLLAHLARNGTGSRPTLISALKASGYSSKEDIDELIERGFIEDKRQAVTFTPRGLELRIELAAVYKSIESDALQSLGSNSAQSLKILLGKLVESLSH